MKLAPGTFLLAATLLATAPALAQFGPAGPPSVGVQKVTRQNITESNSFVGRIQATDRVDIVARVTAFIELRSFQEGAEVEKGDQLYRLERGPFEADLAARQATVAQNEALLKNAIVTTRRAQQLLNTAAGRQSDLDAALSQQQSIEAQVLAARAQARASQINLDYTVIRAPVAGKIGRSALAVGNVVTPNSGPLVSIVSQDPMYVTFPAAVRTVLDLRNRYAAKGGFSALRVKLVLADGRTYEQTGQLDYADPSVTAGTDTLTLRARIPNPLRPGAKPDEPGNRELLDGEFVTVKLEGAEPVASLAIPRAAVLSDQQGSFVYVLGAENKVEVRRIQLGQSTPALAIIASGLTEGETVIVDGLQRVRPGIAVNPSPAAPTPAAPSRT